jgi:hypothetical protein
MFKRMLSVGQSWFRTPETQDFWMFMMLCTIPLVLAVLLLWMNPVSVPFLGA